MEKEFFEKLIAEHNSTVNTITVMLQTLNIKAEDLLKVMPVFHKLVCEGATIVQEARKHDIDCKIDM